MKRIRIGTLILLLVVILGIGLAIGGVMNQYVFNSSEVTPQKVQTWPLPSTMEYSYPAQLCQTTRDEYWKAAYEDSQEMSLYLDIAFPGAKVMWKERGGFSSKEEIANFLANAQFGCCRHRTAYAYWFLQALYPASEIRAVVGYVYVPALEEEEGKVRISVDERDELDSNHAWLMIDGEVFDPTLNPQTVRYYHPYGWSFYQKEIEMGDDIPHVKQITFPRYGVYREEVEEQFRYDKGLVKTTPKEDIPPWWYQD